MIAGSGALLLAVLGLAALVLGWRRQAERCAVGARRASLCVPGACSVVPRSAQRSPSSPRGRGTSDGSAHTAPRPRSRRPVWSSLRSCCTAASGAARRFRRASARRAIDAWVILGLEGEPRSMTVPSDINVPSDIAIAQAAALRPIAEVAADLGLGPDEILPYGSPRPRSRSRRSSDARRADGWCWSRDHADAGRRGQDHLHGRPEPGARARWASGAWCALREPSLGPVFGVKGGGTGGGTSQVGRWTTSTSTSPATSTRSRRAHNLLSAMVDNHLHHGQRARARPAPDHAGRARST